MSAQIQATSAEGTGRSWGQLMQSMRRRVDARPRAVSHARCFRLEPAALQLSDDELLRVCRLSQDDPELTAEHVNSLHCVAHLLGPEHDGTDGRRELGLALLASVLGGFPANHPTHQPDGYGGPVIKLHGHVSRRTLERTAGRIVGILWPAYTPSDVESRVKQAIAKAISNGSLQKRPFDTWRPGMPSGSGWRLALLATPSGIRRARKLAGIPIEPSLLAKVPAGTIDAASPQNHTTRPRSIDDRYHWAHQIELVRATNQVLGEGMVNKGTLSRACTDGHVETNGKPGRAQLVRIQSFLAWLRRQNELDTDETTQIRNAVIGEITARAA